MNEHRELMIRALIGEADDRERESLREQLERDPELRAENDRLAALQGALATEEKKSFGPFFAARVMHRIASERSGSGSMYESLRWMFARIAVVGFALIAGLGLYNTVIASNAEFGSSALESALGVPAENLETVYLLASE